jgi:hypothetical protein
VPSRSRAKGLKQPEPDHIITPQEDLWQVGLPATSLKYKVHTPRVVIEVE